MFQTTIIEVLPQKACLEAKKSCDFLVTSGIWPKFLNCKDHVPKSFANLPLLTDEEYNRDPEKLKLFNEDCDVRAKNFLFKCIMPNIL